MLDATEANRQSTLNREAITAAKAAETAKFDAALRSAREAFGEELVKLFSDELKEKTKSAVASGKFEVVVNGHKMIDSKKYAGMKSETMKKYLEYLRKLGYTVIVENKRLRVADRKSAFLTRLTIKWDDVKTCRDDTEESAIAI